MLEEKISYYKKTKQTLYNTPAQYKKEFPWLREVDSSALCNAQMNLQKAYGNFFSNSLKKEHFGEFLKYVIIFVFILAVAIFLIVILPMLRNRDYIEYQNLKMCF